ncbi:MULTISPECIES: hypothetical protein [Brevibacillus]|jgi:hypothetical protein|uniref:hypothetical protein n=1 Tax=Brevibacillus TaxID=55080 RepID=UPI00156B84DD|nr:MULTISPECIES: hypothetical protein [Brevibacillus]MED1954926.1 hypothetical protein [Brevibacillus centrosporus]NRQ51969.1 hypothetical protein [Brevibacillus sp. HD1.4A]
MSAVEKEEFVVKYPLEKGVRVVIIEDGNVVESCKLEAHHRFTIITQDDKLLDTEETKRKRYRKAK